jgi:hypothetical protein
MNFTGVIFANFAKEIFKKEMTSRALKKKKEELPANLADLAVFRFKDSGLYKEAADFDFGSVLDACVNCQVFDISGCDCKKPGHQAFMHAAHKFVISSKSIVEFKAVDCKFRKTELDYLTGMIEGWKFVTKIEISYLSFLGKEKSDHKDLILHALFCVAMNAPSLVDAKLINFGFSETSDLRCYLEKTSLRRLDISGNNYRIGSKFLDSLCHSRNLVCLEMTSNRGFIQIAHAIVERNRELNRTLEFCMLLSLICDYDPKWFMLQNIQREVLKEIERIALDECMHKNHGPVWIFEKNKICVKCFLGKSPSNAIWNVEETSTSMRCFDVMTQNRFKDGLPIDQYHLNAKHKKKVELKKKEVYSIYMTGTTILKGAHDFVAWDGDGRTTITRVSEEWLYPFIIPGK